MYLPLSMKLLARFIFWLTGWKTAGTVPPLKKFVVIAAPHTAGRDFIYGMCARYLFDVDFKYFAKAEVFRPPFGWLFRALGGIPIDRSNKRNVVDVAVQKFNESDAFILALAPEGTREYVAKWRTGFYYIALNARVPIVCGYLDFEHKIAGIGPTFYPTGDIEKDMEELKAFYKPIKGKYPEKGVH